MPREGHTQFSQRRLLVWGTVVNRASGQLIVVARLFCKFGVSQRSPQSKALCIEPRSTLMFGVSASASVRHMRHRFGFLSDHEMYDRARPGRSEDGCVPALCLTIGEPCERRQQNERYTGHYPAGGGNVREKQGALYE